MHFKLSNCTTVNCLGSFVTAEAATLTVAFATVLLTD